MKLTDNLVNNIGSDKLLHFAFGGWLVAMSSIYGYAAILTVTVLLLILSVIKELAFDKMSDWRDALWTMYGCGLSLINWAVAMELKYGMNFVTNGLKYCCNWK